MCSQVRWENVKCEKWYIYTGIRTYHPVTYQFLTTSSRVSYRRPDRPSGWFCKSGSFHIVFGPAPDTRTHVTINRVRFRVPRLEVVNAPPSPFSKCPFPVKTSYIQNKTHTPVSYICSLSDAKDQKFKSHVRAEKWGIEIGAFLNLFWAGALWRGPQSYKGVTIFSFFSHFCRH